MLQDKRVSIITPSFNRADIIGETAESIFNQTYPNWEWVIVDDGSTDNSWRLLQEYAAKDNRVKIFKRDREPKGAAVCRNIAVERATGDYLIFLDTDDLMAPFCLEQRVKAMEENSKCDFIVFPMLLFEKSPFDYMLLWNIDKQQDDLERILVNDPLFQGTGTLWKRQSFMDVGLWWDDLALWQDIELHIRSLLHPVTWTKRMDLVPDVYLRESPNSLSRGNYHSPAKTKSRIEVFSFACNRLAELKMVDNYQQGLKKMALDILLSAIASGQFVNARIVLSFCSKFKLFTQPELKIARQYILYRKLKGYKLFKMDSFFTNKLELNAMKDNSTVGRIKWTKDNLAQPVAIAASSAFM